LAGTILVHKVLSLSLHLLPPPPPKKKKEKKRNTATHRSPQLILGSISLLSLSLLILPASSFITENFLFLVPFFLVLSVFSFYFFSSIN
jgi:hypothetical protein